MLKYSEKSKQFLQKNIPDVLNMNNIGQALEAVYDWIDLNGFRFDGLYNEAGKEAQEVYDDLYWSN